MAGNAAVDPKGSAFARRLVPSEEERLTAPRLGYHRNLQVREGAIIKDELNATVPIIEATHRHRFCRKVWGPTQRTNSAAARAQRVASWSAKG
jgi:hypothetical protein